MSYFETAAGLMNGVTTMAKSITIGKFIRWIFVIICISAFVFYVFDQYSSTFYYNKLERKIELVGKIKTLGAADSTLQAESNKQLFAILQSIDPKNAPGTLNLDLVWIVFIKILAAVIIPLLCIIGYRTQDKEERKSLVMGGVLFMIVFGVTAYLLPVINSLWVNFFLIVAAEILVLLLITYRKR